MSDTVLTIIGSVVGVAALGVMIAVAVFFWKMATKAQANSVSNLTLAAAGRGWQFENIATIGEIRRKWTGNTDGIDWVATYTGIINNGADKSFWSHTFRWRSALGADPGSSLVLVHERSKLDGVDEKLDQLPGFLKGLASRAIDKVAAVFFGPEAADVDLSKWQAVDGHRIPAMRVLAAEADNRALMLSRRVAEAVIRETAALASGGKPPVILIRRDSVHLATTTDVSDADVERAVRLGVGIVKALTPRQA